MGGLRPDEGSGPTPAPSVEASAGAAAAPSRGARVVSLVPAASSLLVALGAGHQVVARATDDRTPELDDRPRVGYLLSPSLEAIRGAEPDVVVAWAGADLRALRHAVGTSAVLLPLTLDRLRDVPHALRSLAAAVGRPDRGERLADSLKSGLRAVEEHARGAPVVRVLWVVSATPAVAAGPGTLPDDLMRVAGARNVLAGAAAPWPVPSMEDLLRLDPDVIVWPVGQGLPAFDSLPDGALWRVLPAARKGRVIEVEADLVQEAGPRVAEAALHLWQRLLLHRPSTSHPSHDQGSSP